MKVRIEMLKIYLKFITNITKDSITIESFVIFVAGLKHN